MERRRGPSRDPDGGPSRVQVTLRVWREGPRPYPMDALFATGVWGGDAPGLA